MILFLFLFFFFLSLSSNSHLTFISLEEGFRSTVLTHIQLTFFFQFIVFLIANYWCNIYRYYFLIFIHLFPMYYAIFFCLCDYLLENFIFSFVFCCQILNNLQVGSLILSYMIPRPEFVLFLFENDDPLQKQQFSIFLNKVLKFCNYLKIKRSFFDFSYDSFLCICIFPSRKVC